MSFSTFRILQYSYRTKPSAIIIKLEVDIISRIFPRQLPCQYMCKEQRWFTLGEPLQSIVDRKRHTSLKPPHTFWVFFLFFSFSMILVFPNWRGNEEKTAELYLPLSAPGKNRTGQCPVNRLTLPNPLPIRVHLPTALPSDRLFPGTTTPRCSRHCLLPTMAPFKPGHFIQ